MPKVAGKQAADRREEILDACEMLIQRGPLQHVTIKAIGAATSFTRTSLYNYFPTCEEIFLALLERELRRWGEDLASLCAEQEALSADTLAELLARSLERRRVMLSLMARSLNELEENCRLEPLAAFLQAQETALTALDALLRKLQPAVDERQRRCFVTTFLPYLYSLYPFTAATEKQRMAAALAGVERREESIYSLCRTCAENLLASPLDRTAEEPKPNILTYYRREHTMKKLVAYFSATGTTKAMAVKMAQAAGADLYAIEPEHAYTAADLDWTDMNSLSSLEKAGKSVPALADKSLSLAPYGVVMLGFPIWWFTAPAIIKSFLAAHDFAGKKLVLFATSEGSVDLKKIAKELEGCVSESCSIETGLTMVGKASYLEIIEWAQASGYYD